MHTEWASKGSRSVMEGVKWLPNAARSVERSGRIHTKYKGGGAKTSWPQLKSKPGTWSYEVQRTATTVPSATREKVQREVPRAFRGCGKQPTDRRHRRLNHDRKTTHGQLHINNNLSVSDCAPTVTATYIKFQRCYSAKMSSRKLRSRSHSADSRAGSVQGNLDENNPIDFRQEGRIMTGGIRDFEVIASNTNLENRHEETPITNPNSDFNFSLFNIPRITIQCMRDIE